jgi:hypothetical protein
MLEEGKSIVKKFVNGLHIFYCLSIIVVIR